ncbi:MAG: type IV pilus biogenesis/stability protein PilW [Desulfamplus sp.]
MKNSDMQVEYKEILAYVDLQSGIIVDYFYHDSDLNGHDDSESLFLKSIDAKRKGTKINQIIDMLEKSVSLNERNHRALNNLAWELIDNDIDVKKGIDFAKKAVSVFPDSPYNNGTLGIGYFKLGDKNNAKKYLQEAVNLFPIYAPTDIKSLEHDKKILQLVSN